MEFICGEYIKIIEGKVIPMDYPPFDDLICGDKDSLPSHPKLELFHFSSADMKDAYGNSVEPRFASPSYRINAYDIGSLKGGLEGRLWNTSSKKRLSCKENKMTLFLSQKKQCGIMTGEIFTGINYM